MSDEMNTQQTEDAAAKEQVEKVEDIEIREGEAAASESPDGSSKSDSDDASKPDNAVAAELASLKDQLLRTQAEMQNVRRRAEQDVEKAHKFALEKFAGDLLAVADNLERALDAADREDEKQKAVAEGVELTLKSLLDVFRKYNIEQIDPAGEPFDPQQHEALTMVPNPAVEPNTVIDVMQKGYTLNGRLIRAARVVVSKEA